MLLLSEYVVVVCSVKMSRNSAKLWHMESITLNSKQQRKLDILTAFLADRLTKSEAAQRLGISTRQLERVIKKFQENGIACLVHGNSGRSPGHTTPADTIETIRSLAGEGCKYHDFNTCHLHDLLAREEGIIIGRSTLDRLLKREGLRETGKTSRHVKRMRRERSPAEGMMLQIDGSPHDWLEERGPRMALMGAIDDATGKVVYAHFRPTEDQIGYLLLFRQVAVTYGLPECYYHDRHTILRSPKKPDLEDELAGRKPQSQLQRVLEQLGVTSIAAGSPQAKGRVERLWQTLQDRLLREMRLEGIQTLDAANDFLPTYLKHHNQRFAVQPADPESAWVPLPRDIDLAYYFSIQERRVVRADHTVSWMGKTLLVQRERGQSSLAGKPVQVHVVPEGTIHLYDGKTPLCYQVLPERPPKAEAPTAKPVSAKPPVDRESRARQTAWLHAM